MDSIVRKQLAQQTLILGGALLLGVLEFVALQRSSWLVRQNKKHALPAAA